MPTSPLHSGSGGPAPSAAALASSFKKQLISHTTPRSAADHTAAAVGARPGESRASQQGAVAAVGRLQYAVPWPIVVIPRAAAKARNAHHLALFGNQRHSSEELRTWRPPLPVTRPQALRVACVCAISSARRARDRQREKSARALETRFKFLFLFVNHHRPDLIVAYVPSLVLSNTLARLRWGGKRATVGSDRPSWQVHPRSTTSLRIILQ